MKLKLIEALRTAAKKIQSPSSDYCWGEMRTCNCGILASCLVGRVALDDTPLVHSRGIESIGFLNGPWGALAIEGGECYQTGKPMNVVIKALFDAGLTPEDIRKLEFLADPEILKRAGLPRLQFTDKIAGEYSNPAHVARYMEAWAEMLLEGEARHADGDAQVEPNEHNSFLSRSPEKSASNSLRAIPQPILHLVDVRGGKAVVA